MSETSETFTTPNPHIKLTAQDWFWATWRELIPLSLPKKRPFEADRLFKQLSKVRRKNSYWQWQKLDIPLSMSSQEARFWFNTIFRTSPFGNPKNIRLSEREQILSNLEQPPTVDEVQQGITNCYMHLNSVMIRPLFNLLSFESVVNLIANPWDGALLKKIDLKHGHYYGNYASRLGVLAAGFENDYIPYITAEQRTTAQDIVRAHATAGDHWIDDPYYQPYRLFLMARLGMHEEIDKIVNGTLWQQHLTYKYKWSGRDTFFDERYRPAEILFGLNDLELMRKQFEHIPLRTAGHVLGWLAHFEGNHLDHVVKSISIGTNKKTVTEMTKALGLAHLPQTAEAMFALLGSKAAAEAKKWLDDQPELSIKAAVKLATQRGNIGQAAQTHLAEMKLKGHDDLLADMLGAVPEAAKVEKKIAAQEQTTYQPLTEIPAWLSQAAETVSKRAKAPNWVEAALLPPLLINGRALPIEYVEKILIALKQSKLEAPQPLATAVHQHADVASQDQFARALFERADQTGSADKWVLAAMGLLGGDGSALKLTPRINQWPRQSRHSHAKLGIAALSAIGTDTALMQLYNLSRTSKYNSVKQEAADMLTHTAAKLNITQIELEDRIVPDCGLDERGQITFDFGPRQFQFVLTAEFTPKLRDAKGKIRTTLPKPTKKDDEPLAHEATEQWKLLKKQLRDVLKVQTPRLEQALGTGRRWSAANFEQYLLRHPLMSHLIRFFVWGVYDANGQRVTAVRVTDEQDLATADDTSFPFDPTVSHQFGLLHPLEVESAERETWQELLLDYELLPPFPQLNRPIYSPANVNIQGEQIFEFDGQTVYPRAVTSTLIRLGWQGGGYRNEYHVKLYAQHGVQAIFYHTISYGNSMPIEMGRCYFQRPSDEYNKQRPLSEIPPLVFSETVHDLMLLSQK